MIATESQQDTIDGLRARIAELEDFQVRVEENAASMVAMADDLAVAKRQAEEALTKQRTAEEKIRKLAMFDPLTGISNRNSFDFHFREAIQYASRHRSSVGLLLCDLDGFKAVNDHFGHQIGDELLVYVSQQLANATRESDTIARLGGDEFAIVLTMLGDDIRSSTVARRIIKALGDPVTLDGCLIHTGTSVGISVYPRDGDNEEELLRKADKALYAAKDNGKGTFQYFDEEMERRSRDAQVIENDLRIGIVRDEFDLHFQPQVMLGDTSFIGAEALVRWNHPTRGLIMPGTFIEIAEHNGLIRELGRLVLRKACQQCKDWVDSGKKVDRVAVNVSAIQFRNDGFIDEVQRVLSETALDPHHLELEITESMLMDDITKVSKTLKGLHDIGVKISVDDFGTGYSSLSYLKKLPIHSLKIDQSFVRDMTTNKEDSAITAAIINMGHGLGLNVVAEGVETEMQANVLDRKGCDHFQGFFFSRPLPPDNFLDWLGSREHG